MQWANDFVTHNSTAFAAAVVGPFQQNIKKDDLADSLLLVAYYLDTYSNQLSNSTDFVVPGDVSI